VEAPEAEAEDLGILAESEGVKLLRRRVTVPTLAVKKLQKARNPQMLSRASLLSPSAEVVAEAAEGLSGPGTSVEDVEEAASTSTLTKKPPEMAKWRMVTTMRVTEAVEVEVAAAVEAVVAEVSVAVAVSEAASVAAQAVSVAVHAVVAVEVVEAAAVVVASVAAAVAAKAALKQLKEHQKKDTKNTPHVSR